LRSPRATSRKAWATSRSESRGSSKGPRR
jgi:hypothetical protein